MKTGVWVFEKGPKKAEPQGDAHFVSPQNGSHKRDPTSRCFYGTNLNAACGVLLWVGKPFITGVHDPTRRCASCLAAKATQP